MSFDPGKIPEHPRMTPEKYGMYVQHKISNMDDKDEIDISYVYQHGNIFTSYQWSEW